MLNVQEKIIQGKTSLGIELGSTRIKTVLITDNFQTIATGNYDWENQLIDGIWTYSLEDVWKGVQESYRSMVDDVYDKYDVQLKTIGSIGFSAMMHGYLAFDKYDQLLTPFRTWRNGITEDAERILTQLFSYNIPQRWSIAHLYQALLNKESHIQKIDFFTTLAGYVHWQLTGEKVLGIGDASGMFPINVEKKDYNYEMIEKFDQQVAEYQVPWNLKAILPKILLAGANAGYLTEAGARLIDPSGNLASGIPFCPPEGDAGTGMVATNSVAKKTGNVSAGTSAFAMIVLEHDLHQVYPEIDLVTTPVGDLVAMVHTNNCTSEINSWMRLFKEVIDVTGSNVSMDELYTKTFLHTFEADLDAGGLLSYGYHSGENITKIAEGRPLFVRSPESSFTLANFMRMHIFSAFGAMKMGMDILLNEKVVIEQIVGHGGIFKTPEVAQRVLSSVVKSPVTVLENAGEGGAWGMALLASYLIRQQENQSLAAFLEQDVFANNEGVTIEATTEENQGFDAFMERYEAGLSIEQAALQFFK